jgi:hypothetical protein
MDITRQKTSDKIVDVTLEAAEPMERIHRSREHGDPQRLPFTRSHAGSVVRR